MRRALVALLLAVPSAGHAGDFPHDEHEGLFPTCAACHGGRADESVEAELTVGPDDCSECHDGEVASEMEWTGETVKAPTNLVFDHDLHVFDFVIDCANCHTFGRDRMDVLRTDPQACFECHDDEASHFDAENDCSMCHVPLTRAPTLPATRIAAFPRPADHGTSWVSEHGPHAHENVGRCAVCHAKDGCEVCHPNADRLEAIVALEADARVAQLVAGREGAWPAPATHGDDWARHHGPASLGVTDGCAKFFVWQMPPAFGRTR